jgi:multisubunit Na+/H+ antiporter MnhG subunit
MTRPVQDARAAQNRKAQQVYRRKREDKMKELEAQVALLGDVKHNLSLAESKLKELALVSRFTTSVVHHVLMTVARNRTYRETSTSSVTP